MLDHDRLLDAATDAVELAMIACRHVQRGLEDLRAMTKDDRSPVTIADYASQGVVAQALREELGAVRLVGEESAGYLRDPAHASHLSACLLALRDSGVWSDVSAPQLLDAIDLGTAEPDNDAGFWTLDPIDGTKGFLRGGQYCVSLAFIRKGIVELGVLGCPNLSRRMGEAERVDDVGTLFYAVRDSGAMMRWTQGQADVEIDVGREDVPADQPARLAESVEAAHTRQEIAAQVMRLASPAGVLPEVRVDSQCKYALVARGDADVYLRLPSKKGYIERIWDHAAGALIAREGGCIVTDVLGRELDFSCGRGLEKNVGIVGAPPSLHARLLDALRRSRPPE